MRWCRGCRRISTYNAFIVILCKMECSYRATLACRHFGCLTFRRNSTLLSTLSLQLWTCFVNKCWMPLRLLDANEVASFRLTTLYYCGYSSRSLHMNVAVDPYLFSFLLAWLCIFFRTSLCASIMPWVLMLWSISASFLALLWRSCSRLSL